MSKVFSGLYTAIATPFSGGAVDMVSLEKLIDAQVAAKISGIVAIGSTGEAATLTPEERKDIIRLSIRKAKGKMSVIVGTGTNSTLSTIHQSQEAQELGADGLLIIAPYYVKPSQQGLLAHYLAVADAVDIPIIVYNVPGRTGVNIEPDTIIELSRHPKIRGVKEASGLFGNIEKIIKSTNDNFSVLSGSDEDTFNLMQYGGDGTIAVASNILVHEMRDFIESCLSKDWREAEMFQREHADLFRDMSIETNPLPVKTIMAEEGWCEESFRLPLTPMSDVNKKKLLSTWRTRGKRN